MTRQSARLAFISALIAIFAVGCRLTPSEPQVTGEWLEAAGSAYSPSDNPTGRMRAEIVYAAENEARAKIREQFDKIVVKPGQTLYQAMEAKPYVWSRIMGLVASTQAYQQEFQEDGSVKVRLRISLDQLREIALYGEEAEKFSGQ